jgi:sulfur carrier protein
MVNGKSRTLEAGVDLASYLLSFDLDLEFVAVGYNGEVLTREELPVVRLQDGDVLEIVKPVGGG